jgi:hypothetical protein
VIYVASSWKNLTGVSGIIHVLRAAGLEVFDFSFGGGMGGPQAFHWSQIDPEYKSWDATAYVEALKSKEAAEGFYTDFGAMQVCDTCVLVLPCGKSAHLELGWFAGAGKRTAILLDEHPEAELMYKMVDLVTPSLMELLHFLGVKD